MKKFMHCVFTLLFSIASIHPAQAAKSDKINKEAEKFIKNIFDDNARYMSMYSDQHFMRHAEQQDPSATVVACADSRVQTNTFHRRPVNTLFFIRNIGNQISTTQGSVEYGIYHLHTPVLLIIGHSQCGAIKAGLGDYSKELPHIVNELDHLHLTKGDNVEAGVIENVHNQVQYALEKFKDKIAKKELVVLGVIYDFSDDFGHGHGQLILLNLNGERDPDKLKKNPYIKDFNNIIIGKKK